MQNACTHTHTAHAPCACSMRTLTYMHLALFGLMHRFSRSCHFNFICIWAVGNSRIPLLPCIDPEYGLCIYVFSIGERENRHNFGTSMAARARTVDRRDKTTQLTCKNLSVWLRSVHVRHTIPGNHVPVCVLIFFRFFCRTFVFSLFFAFFEFVRDSDISCFASAFKNCLKAGHCERTHVILRRANSQSTYQHTHTRRHNQGSVRSSWPAASRPRS